KGETSDNRPGVPGIGDNTAAQLINTYGDIESVIAHAAELTPKVRDGIKAHANQVRVNKELGRLLDDVSLDLDPDNHRLEQWDDEVVRKLFTSLEFRSLHERLKELKLHAAAVSPSLELSSISDFVSEKDLRGSETVAFAWSEEWVALCDRPGEARVLPFSEAIHRLAGCLKDPNRRKIAHDAKLLYRSALTAGIEIQGLHCDTKIASYLLEPGSASGYTLTDTVGRYLGVSMDADKAEPQTGEQTSLSFSEDEKSRVCREAVAVRAVAPVVEERLRNQGIWELATSLEFPLVEVLARMEKNGITEMLLALIDPESHRIHTTYEQTTAATGRLSSIAPNLQNVPIRGEAGRQIRRAFIAPPDHVLLSADYSQIELRVLAHLSE